MKNDTLTIVGAITAIGVLIFFGTLLGTVGGIVGGWIVGLFFSDLILSFLGRIGVDVTGLALWQVGGALGFLGSFFKSYQTNTNK
jgi:hypothetical protein